MLRKTALSGPLLFLHIMLGVPNLQDPDHSYLDHFSGWFMQQVTLRSSKNCPKQKVSLTICYKNIQYSNSIVTQTHCILSIGAHCVASVYHEDNGNQGKYTDNHALYCVMGNKDLCLWARCLLFSSSIHKIVTGQLTS